jgi:methylenetetrahydrofolate reductase (NADPH)
MTKAAFSYEFFPPSNTVSERTFWRSIGAIEALNPSYFSITYGALGTAQARSVRVIKDLLDVSDVPVAAHLTFEGSTIEEIDAVAQHLRDIGVKRIVALRGDAREDAAQARQRGQCYTNVAEFVAGLRSIYPFDISVACYPEVHPMAQNEKADLLELKAKCDAGANRAITQFFFNVDDFERFRDRVATAGITTPVVAGILPIRDYKKMVSFAARCGASIPARINKAYDRVAGDKSAEKAVWQQEFNTFVDQLIERGCNEFHIYTLNQPVDMSHFINVEQRQLAGARAAVA